MLLSSPLTKVLGIVSGISIVLLLASSFYIKSLIGRNAVLREDVKDRELKIAQLDNNYREQKRLYESTLSIIEAREVRISTLKAENTNLNTKLQELKNNDKVVEEYLNVDIPSSVVDLLSNSNSVHREANTNLSSQDSP